MSLVSVRRKAVIIPGFDKSDQIAASPQSGGAGAGTGAVSSRQVAEVGCMPAGPAGACLLCRARALVGVRVRSCRLLLLSLPRQQVLDRPAPPTPCWERGLACPQLGCQGAPRRRASRRTALLVREPRSRARTALHSRGSRYLLLRVLACARLVMR